jgi:hypothetical protein
MEILQQGRKQTEPFQIKIKDEKDNFTSEFLEWFDDSVITDSGKNVKGGGIPKRFYHGTSRDFSVFNPVLSEIGTHFGSVRAANDRNITDSAWTDGHRLIQVYIKSCTPLRLDDVGDFSPIFSRVWANAAANIAKLNKEDLIQNWERYLLSCEQKAVILPGVINMENQERLKIFANEIFIDCMKNLGFDGIIYENHVEGGDKMDSVIIFDNNQVLSATSGTNFV